MNDKQKLHGKYIVQKADGSPVDLDAQYFVLRVDTDPAAQQAVLAYADAIRQAMPTFASQLRKWVNSYLITPPEDGCPRSGQGDGKHKWVRFPSHYACSWCGQDRPYSR